MDKRKSLMILAYIFMLNLASGREITDTKMKEQYCPLFHL